MKSARSLYFLKVAELAFYVVELLLWKGFVLVGASPSSRFLDLWSTASSVVWSALTVTLLVLIMSFARDVRGTSAAGPARIAVALTAVFLGLDLLGLAVQLSDGRLPLPTELFSIVGVATSLVSVGAEAALWLALARALPNAASRTPAYFALLALRLALLLAVQLLPRELIHPLLGFTALGIGFTVLRSAVFVATQVIVLLALRQVAAAGHSSASADAPTPAASASRDLAVGAVMLVLGLAITLASYSAASSSSGGGRYLVATGAIAVGFVRLVRGLIKLSSGT